MIAMSVNDIRVDLGRREVLGFALAASGLLATSAIVKASNEFPGSGIRYGVSGQVWEGDGVAVKAWGGDIAEGIKECARLGFQGIEPFRQHIMKYLDDPMAFKRLLDASGIAMSSCSNGGAGMSTNFIDKDATSKTIDDHVKFARDFIRPIGSTVFKFNMGHRPADGKMTDDQLKTLAGTINEIGRQTIGFGVKAAPHPHIWGPMEREREVRKVMELTDPRYVWMTADTAHLTLGGMDPVKIISDYFPRIAEFHYKDCDPAYRGNSSTPTQEMHQRKTLYLNLGAGGVDFPAVHKIVLQRKYAGWISLDYDAPRPGEGTLEGNLLVNRNYLVNALHVKTLGPAVLGKSACEYVCRPS
jgi:sugar phosphate isomerase/epimerase